MDDDKIFKFLKNIILYLPFLLILVLFLNSVKIYDYLSGNKEKEEIKKSIEMIEFEINKNKSYKDYFCNEDYSLRDLCKSTFPYVTSGKKVCDEKNFEENLFFKKEFKEMSQGYEKNNESCSILKIKFNKEVKRLENILLNLNQ